MGEQAVPGMGQVLRLSRHPFAPCKGGMAKKKTAQPGSLGSSGAGSPVGNPAGEEGQLLGSRSGTGFLDISQRGTQASGPLCWFGPKRSGLRLVVGQRGFIFFH